MSPTALETKTDDPPPARTVRCCVPLMILDRADSVPPEVGLPP